MDNDILHRVRVLDFTTTIAGPHCTRLLADLGADVVKIEAPDGELMRTRPPLRDGVSSYFGQLNAGKRSLVLDLKQPAAVDIVKRLVGDADLVVENFRPGVMKRLGLDYESLRAVRPDLVFCAMSGYGQTGPSSGLPAYAPVIHAASGYDLAHLSYQDGRTRPDNNGVFIADVLTGTYAFGAIAAALYHRRVTGRGQMVDVSMLESMLTMTLSEVQRAQFAMAPPGRPMFGPLQTRDGYLMLAVASERTFQDLARAAGRPDWIDDPRFAVYADRRLNWHLFMDELEHWSRQLRHGRVPGGVRALRRAVLALPHRRGGDDRRPARPPRRLHRGARRRRHVQDAQPAVPVLGRAGRGPAIRLAPRRAQRRGARRGRLYPGRDRRVSQGRRPRLTHPARARRRRVGAAIAGRRPS